MLSDLNPSIPGPIELSYNIVVRIACHRGREKYMKLNYPPPQNPTREATEIVIDLVSSQILVNCAHLVCKQHQQICYKLHSPFLATFENIGKQLTIHSLTEPCI